MRRIPIVRLLRTVGILEGLSFLVLLFIAMPLKYGWGYASAVRVPGLVHGALFMAFVYVLYVAQDERGWPGRRPLLLLGAAVCPFGFLMVDRRLRAEIARASSGDTAGALDDTT